MANKRKNKKKRGIQQRWGIEKRRNTGTKQELHKENSDTPDREQMVVVEAERDGAEAAQKQEKKTAIEEKSQKAATAASDKKPQEPKEAPPEEKPQEPKAELSDKKPQEPKAAESEEKPQEPKAAESEEKPQESKAELSDKKPQESKAAESKEKLQETTAVSSGEKPQESKAAESEEKPQETTVVPSEEKSQESKDVLSEEKNAGFSQDEEGEDEDMNRKLFLQYDGLEFSDSVMFDAAVNDYCTWTGISADEITSVNLYVKPAEGKAYYVINEDPEKNGSIDL